jgi:two-component system chemotaxis sensor kinase CheA
MEAIAHAGETLLERFRRGAQATPEAINTLFAAVDRMKALLADIEQGKSGPADESRELLQDLERAACTVDAGKKRMLRIEAERFDELVRLSGELMQARDQLHAVIKQSGSDAAAETLAPCFPPAGNAAGSAPAADRQYLAETAAPHK